MYEQDPNYQPQFDPNLAQFMQQEQGQYQRHVGGGCRGGVCTSRTPTSSPSSTPTWRSSCSRNKVSTWVGCLGVACVGVGCVRAGPQFDPNLAQFMQLEPGQYQRHVGGGCTSRTPTTTPSLTPTWCSSSSKNKVSTTQTWVGCVGVGDNIYFKGMYSMGWFCGCKFDPNSQFVPNLVQFMQQEQGQYQTNMGGVCRGGVCRGGG